MSDLSKKTQEKNNSSKKVKIRKRVEQPKNPPKKSFGKIAAELRAQEDQKINPIDLERSVNAGQHSKRSYVEEIYETHKRGRELFKGDFFIVVLLKKERLNQNAYRRLFLPRKSCPTPEYDQTVYHCKKNSDEIALQWVVPDIQTCGALPLMRGELPLDQLWLVEYIDAFQSGKLDQRSMELNGEKGKKLQNLIITPK